MAGRNFDNFFITYLTQAITTTGACNIYLATLPSDSTGWIEISPSSTNKREIVYFTAKGPTYVTVTAANRGVGGTTAQVHGKNAEVALNVVAEMLEEFSSSSQSIIGGGVTDAGGVSVAVAAWEGEINGIQVAYAGTAAYTVADNQTNYVELSSAGVLSSNTTGFSADQKRLAIVIAAAGDIVSVTDKRQFGCTTNAFVNSIAVGDALSVTSPTGAVTIDVDYDNITLGIIAGRLAVRDLGIDLTTKVTGVLPEARGGTGETAYAAGDILAGNGVGLTRVPTGAVNQVLIIDPLEPTRVRWAPNIGPVGVLIYAGL